MMLSRQRHSDFIDEVLKKEREYQPEAPYGSIQWHGTDVCMDIHCDCGYHSHIDGEFAFHFECNNCHKKYRIASYVKLFELTESQVSYVNDNYSTGFYVDKDGSMAE